MSWLKELNKQTDLKVQFIPFYRLYVADPAIFLVSNSDLGPHLPLRTAWLFSYGFFYLLKLIMLIYYYFINIVNIKIQIFRISSP